MTGTIEAIFNDPASSWWIKAALQAALERDPVDAVADAEVLLSVLRERCDHVQRMAAEAAGLDLEALQRELWRDGGEMG